LQLGQVNPIKAPRRPIAGTAKKGEEGSLWATLAPTPSSIMHMHSSSWSLMQCIHPSSPPPPRFQTPLIKLPPLSLFLRHHASPLLPPSPSIHSTVARKWIHESSPPRDDIYLAVRGSAFAGLFLFLVLAGAESNPGASRSGSI
jgi:hypothetical protein